jgi:hypothetical protein
MSETFYHGKREEFAAFVWKHHRGVSKPLNPRNDLWNHSPTGFEWGYGGSGPAQLALAILADALHNDDQAVELYQQFKWEMIAPQQGETWKIGLAEVLEWCIQHDQARADELHAEDPTAAGIDLAQSHVEDLE